MLLFVLVRVMVWPEEDHDESSRAATTRPSVSAPRVRLLPREANLIGGIKNAFGAKGKEQSASLMMVKKSKLSRLEREQISLTTSHRSVESNHSPNFGTTSTEDIFSLTSISKI